MTAAEYDTILCPTDADFKAFTRSLFARAAALNLRLVCKYPHLFGKESGAYGGELPLA